jgi:hypothetical protein
MWRRIRGVNRSRRKRRAKHRFQGPKPSGHALAQKKGETNAAWLAGKNAILRRTDDLEAKQLVLNGVVRNIELCGFDDH